MREDTPSRTAAWVAAARHFGRLLPKSAQLADDPYGAAFTTVGLGKLVERAPKGLSLVPGLREWVLYMQVRTRVIDDVVRTFVAEGGRQVVLLGAGYDTRALRLPELADAQVFEVDHPATQGHKQRTLAKLGAESPARYVVWDFEARPMEDLADELAANGHDPDAPTITIWEGVTMYLTEPAIDTSLRAIRSWSAPGSYLAMTYFAKNRFARPTFVTRAMAVVVGQLGEPWKWGWDPAELPGYLEERGLDLAEDISLADAATELLPASLAGYVADKDRRVAVARSAESIAVARPT